MIVSLRKTTVLVFNKKKTLRSTFGHVSYKIHALNGKYLQWEATLLRLLMNISILVIFSTHARMMLSELCQTI